MRDMSKRQFEKFLRRRGYSLIRHTGKHDLWRHPSGHTVPQSQAGSVRVRVLPDNQYPPPSFVPQEGQS